MVMQCVKVLDNEKKKSVMKWLFFQLRSGCGSVCGVYCFGKHDIANDIYLSHLREFPFKEQVPIDKTWHFCDLSILTTS